MLLAASMPQASDNAKLQRKLDQASDTITFYTIYMKLFAVASALVDDEFYARERAARDILDVMDYVRDFT